MKYKDKKHRKYKDKKYLLFVFFINNISILFCRKIYIYKKN